MKAIRKKDGFFMRLSDYVYDEDGTEYTWDEVDLVFNGKLQSQTGEHWNELRERYAGMAMQAMVSDHFAMRRIMERLEETKNGETLQEITAKQSVAFADALIEELKRQ